MCYNFSVSEFLKKHFIPHQENDYRPHVFREASVIAILIVVIALFVSSLGSSFILRQGKNGAAVIASVLVDLTNKDRKNSNVAPLTVSKLLTDSANQKATDMVVNGYFAHTSPAGHTPWYWFNKVGYQFAYAGENLALDFGESSDVENAWLNSPTHRANVLNAHFSEIGIAAVEGVYQGRQTIFVVEHFGKPIVLNETLPEKIIAPTQTAKVGTGSKTGSKTLQGSTVLAESVSTISEDANFIEVENTDFKNTESESTTTAPTYSSWFDRLLFKEPYLVERILSILGIIVVIALILMIFLEFKYQRPKNIMYACFIVIVLIGLLYMNHHFLMIFPSFSALPI